MSGYAGMETFVKYGFNPPTLLFASRAVDNTTSVRSADLPSRTCTPTASVDRSILPTMSLQINYSSFLNCSPVIISSVNSSLFLLILWSYDPREISQD